LPVPTANVFTAEPARNATDPFPSIENKPVALSCPIVVSQVDIPSEENGPVIVKEYAVFGGNNVGFEASNTVAVAFAPPPRLTVVRYDTAGIIGTFPPAPFNAHKDVLLFA
jgi:hypothetical protein